MKANPILIATFAVIFLCAGCTKKEAAPAEEKKSAEPESHVKHGANGEVIVTLDAEAQKRIGLEVVTLTPAQLAPEMKTVGRVLDPANLSGLVGDFESARASTDASGKELERAKTLVKSDNVSARTLQTAEATAARDVSQLEAARAKLIGAFGKEFAAQQNLPELTKSLASGSRAMVRLELPVGEMMPSQLAGARLVSLAEGSRPVAAKFVGTAAVDPQSQTRGLLYLVESNAANLSAGEAVTGFINVSGETQSGPVVPRIAVVRKDGLAWAYVQTSETEFTRREVGTDRPLDAGWFVTRNFAAGDKVVTTGAQIILSTEMSAAGFSDGEHH